ncbi:hypothetical protein ACFWXK_11655 [Streptomyces sp. NPDC059070]|uniref:hypothetical protein n=1 Tax=unclassified Streptomyces TaxID=2593676 RepID=UPI0034E1A2A9
MKPLDDSQAHEAGLPLPPPLPWRLPGIAHAGVFTLARPLDVPGGLHALAPRKLMVFVNRYRGGDASYEVLGLASLVRRKGRVALVLRQVWVDEPGVRHVGRAQGLTPSDPGVFTWEDSGLSVSSEKATAALSWRDRARLALPTPITFTYFVSDGDRLGLVKAPGRATARPISLRLDEWPGHFPELTSHQASFALRLDFTLTVRPPRMIGPP